jgi:hypothetical protein
MASAASLNGIECWRLFFAREAGSVQIFAPCWESQRLIPKRSAGPRATKIGVVSLKALDHHRPNREESVFGR